MIDNVGKSCPLLHPYFHRQNAHHVLSLLAEETHVMPFLDADESDSGGIRPILLQFQARVANGLSSQS